MRSEERGGVEWRGEERGGETEGRLNRKSQQNDEKQRRDIGRGGEGDTKDRDREG